MAVLRTARLWNAWVTSPPGVSTLYVVPQGYRAVLRAADVIILIGAGIGTEIEVDISVGVPGNGVSFFHAIINREAQWASYRGQVVAYAGEAFQIQCGASIYATQGSGALMLEPN